MKRHLLLSLLSSSLLLASSANVDELFELSLDDLMSIQVNDVTRKNEAPFKATSALYTISSEQIRRSGANNIPEALRLVPGVHVGRISGSEYAISIRSVNTALSDDVLVMIDGREVFNRFSNGTHWDSINYVLEDIDRIEVIRGPGGSLWGSNASNGIINIVTKKATNTQGTLFSVRVGNAQDKVNVSARSGFGDDSSYTRLYVTGKNVQRSNIKATQQPAYDGENFSQVGFRHDSENFSIQGDIYSGTVENTSYKTNLNTFTKEYFQDTVKTQGGNILLRYQIQDNIKIQAFYDFTSRKRQDKTNEYHNIDLDYQQNEVYQSQHILFGFGGRFTQNNFNYKLQNSPVFAVDPLTRNDYIGRLFFQDEIQLNDVTITPGIKYEYNTIINSQFQPSLKLGWYPKENLSLWASYARTVSTPSRSTIDGYLDFGSFSVPIGSNITGETLKANTQNVYELGGRIKPSDSTYIDIASFYNDYINDFSDIEKIYGVETTFIYEPSPQLLTELSYTYQEGFKEDTSPLIDLHKHMLTAHVNYTPQNRLETDLYYYFYSEVTGVDALHRIDFHIGYHYTPALYIALLGQNILDEKHIEANQDLTKQVNTYIEQSILLQATLSF